jgi:hypothetical protein
VAFRQGRQACQAGAPSEAADAVQVSIEEHQESSTERIEKVLASIIAMREDHERGHPMTAEEWEEKERKRLEQLSKEAQPKDPPLQ